MQKYKASKSEMKKIEAELSRKLEAASKKNQVSVDASDAEKKRALNKIVKDASKMK